MGFWSKSQLLFKAFRDQAKTSIRQVALQTGLSKSSVHRLRQAMVGRNQHPESWFWETEEGRRWLIRLGDFRKRLSYDRVGILEGFFRNEPPDSTHEVQSCACRT
jgi:hypothetical protein